jgi:hypothetical protein
MRKSSSGSSSSRKNPSSGPETLEGFLFRGMNIFIAGFEFSF